MGKITWFVIGFLVALLVFILLEVGANMYIEMAISPIREFFGLPSMIANAFSNPPLAFTLV